ncbi:MAG: hypothetical protein QFB89_03515 [Pseudomonadota bacterium]|nr:hypothetical protein [Pseudomonadota bacterium]
MTIAAASAPAPNKEQRTRVLMRGVLFAPSGATMVWIRNISSDGAHVTADDPLPADCDVILKRGPIFAAARVKSSDRSGTGLDFYRSLTDEELNSAHLPLPHRED